MALQRLVHALGPESPMTYPIVLPVLRLCTDPNQPDELNLLEDGMHLWLVALRNAPACDDGKKFKKINRSIIFLFDVIIIRLLIY